MPSKLEIAIRRQRQALLKNETQAVQRVLNAYGPSRVELIKRIDAFARTVQERDLTAGEAIRFDRAQELFAQVEEEVARLAGLTHKTVLDTQEQMVAMAGTNALELVQASAGSRAASIASSWNRLNPDAVQAFVGRMGDGSPLEATLRQFGDAARPALVDAIQTGIALGTGPRAVAAELTKVVDAQEWQLLRITRTEILQSYRSATIESYRANSDLGSKWEWICAQSAATCLACIALDGRRFPIAKEFHPHHPCCVIGDTIVSAPPISHAYRRWYSGRVIEIETELGRRLTVTPNHPILTTEGWVDAGLLNESHHLVCGQARQRAVGDGNNDHVPTRIEEVFDARLRTSGMPSISVPTTTVDFHGDGLDGQVDVVNTLSLLGDRGKSAVSEHSAHFDFVVGTDEMRSLLFRGGSLDEFFVGSLRTPYRAMGRVGESLALLRRRALHSREHAFAAIAGGDSLVTQGAHDRATYAAIGVGQRLDGFARLESPRNFGVDDPALFSAIGGGSIGYDSNSGTVVAEYPSIDQLPSKSVVGQPAHGLNEADHRLPADVTIDRIVEIRSRTFDGHVFNLSTENEWYSANGIITHNCRCSSLFVLDGIGTPKRQLASDWMNGQPEAVQRQMVPASAWEDYSSGKLHVTDFVKTETSDGYGEQFRQASVQDAKAAAARRAA